MINRDIGMSYKLIKELWDRQLIRIMLIQFVNRLGKITKRKTIFTLMNIFITNPTLDQRKMMQQLLSKELDTRILRNCSITCLEPKWQRTTKWEPPPIYLREEVIWRIWALRTKHLFSKRKLSAWRTITRSKYPWFIFFIFWFVYLNLL